MTARRLTAALAALMVVQSSLGLAFEAQYRDVEWIRATWYGNDWVTLTVVAPALVVARAGASRGNARGVLLWLGVSAYAAYNYAFYLFGAALNSFFLLYVAAVVVAAAILITALPTVDAGAVSARFYPLAPRRVLGGYFVFVALGLATVWVAMWAAYVVVGRPTPIEVDAFRLVAALDLSFLVPILGLGGVLLWRKHTWGPIVGSIAGVAGSLYLFVLCVNSVVAMGRGLVAVPGELPLWAPLFLFTVAATVGLLLSLTDGQDGGPRPSEHQTVKYGRQIADRPTTSSAEAASDPAGTHSARWGGSELDGGHEPVAEIVPHTQPSSSAESDKDSS